MHICLLMPCKGLTSWLSFVMSNCDVLTFPLVSWVRCGAWLYLFLIFALFLTLYPLCIGLIKRVYTPSLTSLVLPSLYSLHAGKFSLTFCRFFDFFSKLRFSKISFRYTMCPAAWILISPDILSGLIRVQNSLQGLSADTIHWQEMG